MPQSSYVNLINPPDHPKYKIRKMSEIEFFAKIKPKRLTSLAEDFKEWQTEFLVDEKRNALKRRRNAQPEPVEITYERFPEEG